MSMCNIKHFGLGSIIKIMVLDREHGRIQDFKLGRGALKKIAPSGGKRVNFWGISCEKSRFYAKKIIFFPILGGGARVPPPPMDPPLERCGQRVRIRKPVLWIGTTK